MYVRPITFHLILSDSNFYAGDACVTGFALITNAIAQYWRRRLGCSVTLLESP